MRKNVFFRWILPILTLIFSLSHFSCSAVYGYSEPEDRYLVSALGFDEEEGRLAVYARIVTENSTEVRVFRGLGDSVEYAMAHMEGADSKQLELSHLAVIAVGDGVSYERLSEIFDYCAANDDVTVGVRFASTHVAAELLELDGADGYTLTSALREGREGSGYTAGCKFYEIENGRLTFGERAYWHLPYFSVWDGEYTLDGLKIYTSSGAVRLDRGESGYYMMLTGEFDGGALDVVCEDREYSIFVRSSVTGCREEGGSVYIECEIEVNGELLPSENAEIVAASISERAEKLCRQLFSRYGDVLGLEKRLCHPISHDGEIFVRVSI